MFIFAKYSNLKNVRILIFFKVLIRRNFKFQKSKTKKNRKEATKTKRERKPENTKKNVVGLAQHTA
jgi:hypothetical protein